MQKVGIVGAGAVGASCALRWLFVEAPMKLFSSIEHERGAMALRRILRMEPRSATSPWFGVRSCLTWPTVRLSFSPQG